MIQETGDLSFESPLLQMVQSSGFCFVFKWINLEVLQLPLPKHYWS